MKYVLLSLLLLIGCSSSKSSGYNTNSNTSHRNDIPGWPKDAIPYTFGETTIYVTSSTTPIELKRIEDAIAYIYSDYENYNGYKIPPTTIGICHDIGFYYGGNWFTGMWGNDWGVSDTICCVEGSHQELPGLFHELQHRVRHIYHKFPNDDPEWIGWNHESDRLASILYGR